MESIGLYFQSLIGDQSVTDFVLDSLTQAINERKISYDQSRLILYFVGDLMDTNNLFMFLEQNLSPYCVRYRENSTLSESTSLVLLDTIDESNLDQLKKHSGEYAIVFGGSVIPTIKYSESAAWQRLLIVEMHPDHEITMPFEMNEGDFVTFFNARYKDYQKRIDYRFIPEKIIEATEKIRLSFFDYNEFINDCCSIDANLSIDSRDLYNMYRAWCLDTKQHKCDTYQQFLYLMRDRFVLVRNMLSGIGTESL